MNSFHLGLFPRSGAGVAAPKRFHMDCRAGDTSKGVELSGAGFSLWKTGDSSLGEGR